MARKPNAVDRLMGEVILYGGPAVTRAEAVRLARNDGLNDTQIAYTVFAREAVDRAEINAEYNAPLRVHAGLPAELPQ